MAAIVVAGVGLDQATKAMAVQWLTGHDPVRLVSDIFQLSLVRNPGAAFSAGANATVVFSVLALLVTVGLCVWVVPKVRSKMWAVVVGLALAGIVGNFIDRLVRSPGLFRGHVVDFFALKHFAVFNVADMMLTAAAILVVIVSFFGKGLSQGSEGEADGSGEESDDTAEATKASDGESNDIGEATKPGDEGTGEGTGQESEAPAEAGEVDASAIEED
jgi:signal peptidase II